MESLREVAILNVASLQLTLETIDQLKDTKLYVQAIKNRTKTLEKDIEKHLKGEISDGFLKDQKDFLTLMEAIENIQNWIATRKDFNEVVRLADNLKLNTPVLSMGETQRLIVRSLSNSFTKGDLDKEGFLDRIEQVLGGLEEKTINKYTIK